MAGKIGPKSGVMKIMKQREKMKDSGNSKQVAALHKLLSALKTVRGFADLNYTTEIRPVKLLVMLDLPDFPVISIGRAGGFDMPDIRSYDQIKGASDSFTCPGQTAFDACLFGDKHVLRQGSGA